MSQRSETIYDTSFYHGTAISLGVQTHVRLFSGFFSRLISDSLPHEYLAVRPNKYKLSQASKKFVRYPILVARGEYHWAP